ncbi:MAG: hypothetical protein ACYTDT_13590 [Planctomycetota bacterium]|jgi:hypothetical protein
MRYLVTGILTFALLCAVNTHAHAEEFKDGWNTWKDSKVGDMVVYAIGTSMSKKFEVEKVDEGKITYKQTILDAKGKVLGKPNSLTREWKRIKMLARIPSGNGIAGEWRKETYESGEIKIECDVYKYSQKNGELNGEIWFSKSVPCGGVVQQSAGGKRSIWLTEFKTENKNVAGDTTEKVVVSELPEFFAKKGNYIVVKITKPGSDTVFQKREIVAVAEKSSTLKSTDNVNKDGTEKATSKDREIEQTKAAYDKMFASPEKEDVVVKTEAGEFKCGVYTKKYTKMTLTTWVHKGIPIKQVSSRDGKETVLEVVKVHWVD